MRRLCDVGKVSGKAARMRECANAVIPALKSKIHYIARTRCEPDDAGSCAIDENRVRPHPPSAQRGRADWRLGCRLDGRQGYTGAAPGCGRRKSIR
jgi:hypothetical protein